MGSNSRSVEGNLEREVEVGEELTDERFWIQIPKSQAISLAFNPAFIATASNAKTAAVKISDRAEPKG